MIKVFVTGAKGLIGGTIYEYLSPHYDVTGLDIDDDVSTRTEAISKAHVLIHMAAKEPFSHDLDSAFEGLLALRETLSSFGGRHLIVASSVAVEPDAFALGYPMNYYSARLAATEVFARAWLCWGPDRTATAMRFGHVTTQHPNLGHRQVRTTSGAIRKHIEATLNEHRPGFHIRYAIGDIED